MVCKDALPMQTFYLGKSPGGSEKPQVSGFPDLIRIAYLPNAFMLH
jgi:hypothetical protein